MSSNTLRIDREFILPGTLEDVWLCLSDSEECSLWQGDDCEIGDEAGQPVSLFGGWVKGKIRSIDPKRQLSYTWDASDWEEGTPSSVVTYKLQKIDESTTRVSLVHHTFPSEKERDSHDKGWDDHFFGPMKSYLLQIQE